MTIGYVARRLVEAYGRDAARDIALIRAWAKEWKPNGGFRYVFWVGVARACTWVPVPARRGATP